MVELEIKHRQEVTCQILRLKNDLRSKTFVWSGMSGSGILLDPCYFVGNVNNGSYFDTSDNFDLPQLQDFFMTQFENCVFQHLW